MFLKCVRNLQSSLGSWAPFIPDESRKTNDVMSTEHLKGVEDDTQQMYVMLCMEKSLLKAVSPREMS